MFLSLDILLNAEHQPDVLGKGFHTTEQPRISVEPSIVGQLIFPPFDFIYQVALERDGRIWTADNLADESALVCLPYDFEGRYIPFDAETFAAAWTYLLYTDRSVVRRPTARGLFERRTVTRNLGIPLLTGIVAGNSGWSIEPGIDTLRESAVFSAYVDGLAPDPYRLELVDLYLQDGMVISSNRDQIPPDCFLVNRDKIVQSLGAA